MTIKRFDKQECRTLGKAIEEALKPVAKKFGVNINRKGGRFSDSNFVTKIEASVISKDGTVLSREAQDFKIYCKMYNLKPSDLGKTFKSDTGASYVVTGLSTRSRKYPILAEEVATGKGFKLPEITVQRGLGRQVKLPTGNSALLK